MIFFVDKFQDKENETRIGGYPRQKKRVIFYFFASDEISKIEEWSPVRSAHWFCP